MRSVVVLLMVLSLVLPATVVSASSPSAADAPFLINRGRYATLFKAEPGYVSPPRSTSPFVTPPLFSSISSSYESVITHTSTITRSYSGPGTGRMPSSQGDPQVAAGLTQTLALVNQAYILSDKATGNLLAPPTSTNEPPFVQPGEYETDAVIIFDAPSNRWFAAWLGVGSGGVHLYVAASSDRDVTKDWYIITAVSGSIDQPHLGISSDKVAVAWSTLSGAPASVIVYSKQDLMDGPPIFPPNPECVWRLGAYSPRCGGA